MARLLKPVGCICALLLLLSFALPGRKIKIFLIGDSTMADKRVSEYPETGWGMPFHYFFDSGAVVDNKAMNGRSTSSFIKEGRWKAVMDVLKEDDYVLIQFGHNDEVPTKKTYTPPADYKANLIRFVTDCKSKGANPVLITPVSRRSFDATGHITDTHKQYAELVREAAAETHTPLIDLDKESADLLNEWGVERSKDLFDYVVPGEHPNYPKGKEDNTHFSELGARKMAEIVLHDIQRLQLPLAGYIVDRTIKK